MKNLFPKPDFSKPIWRLSLVVWIVGLNVLFYLSFIKSTARFWGRLLAYVSGS